MKHKIAPRKSDEGYSVSCPALPGCWSQGETELDATENIKVAIAEYLAAVADSMGDVEVREVEL